MRKVTNLGLNSFSGCKKLTKITAPVRFFKDEYIQEVNRDVAKGLKDTEDEERLYSIWDAVSKVTAKRYGRWNAIWTGRRIEKSIWG